MPQEYFKINLFVTDIVQFYISILYTYKYRVI